MFDVNETREDDEERVTVDPRHTSVFEHDVIKIGISVVAVGVGYGVGEGVLENDGVIELVAVIVGVESGITHFTKTPVGLRK